MSELEQMIKNQLINFDGQVSIYATDFNTEIKINCHEKCNPASCIKTFILVDLFKQVYFGLRSLKDKLVYTQDNLVDGSGVLQYLSFGTELKVLDVATLMMIVSDNVATNMMIDYLGIKNINNTIKSLGCYDTELFSKFESTDDKAFAKTTARDYGYIFELILKNKLWDKSISEYILEIMKKQKYTEMIGDGIGDLYTKTPNELLNFVATKSGKYTSVRNDGGIVSTKYGNYILTIFIYDFDDKYLINDKNIYDIGKNISNLVFNRYIALKGKFE